MRWNLNISQIDKILYLFLYDNIYAPKKNDKRIEHQYISNKLRPVECYRIAPLAGKTGNLPWKWRVAPALIIHRELKRPSAR